MQTLACNQVWGGIRGEDLHTSTGGIAAALFSRPCQGGRGGDVYYFSVCAQGLLSRIVLADVAGHGEPVSAISQSLYELMVAHTNDNSQGEMLSDLSRMASRWGHKPMATAAVAAYYRGDSNLYYAYAGHPPLLVWMAADPRWRPVDLSQGAEVANLPLGVEPSAPYHQDSLPLGTGDRFFLYTDGLVEAPGLGEEPFGTERLIETLNAAAGRDLAGLKEAVLRALDAHSDGRLDHDDVTFLAAEVL